MSDMTPLNDPELTHLERRLTDVALPPTSRQRDRLLYACGHAAGRAQIGRRVRAVTAVAVMLTCVSAGLSYVLLTRNASKTVVSDSTPMTAVEGEPANGPIHVPLQEQPEFGNARGLELTAGTSFEQLLTSDRERTTEPLSGDAPGPSSKRLLTAASRSWLDEFWD